MAPLEKAIVTLNAYMSARAGSGIDIRAQLAVAIAYDVAVLTVPLFSPAQLLWLMCYPILMAEAFGVGYWSIFKRSLWVLPLVILIGIFNPLLDHQPMWVISGVTVSRGWVSFLSLTLRGLLSVQALLLLVSTSGFTGICRAMAKVGVPDVLVTQLMMLYRYLSVLLSEALTMHRSRQSRGFGRKSYPLRLWGVFVGQLLLRSIQRAGRINRAMIARGFDGRLYFTTNMQPVSAKDWLYVIAWIAAIIAIRIWIK